MYDVTASTRQGLVGGERLRDGVLRFRGIPYAKAPVGALRWQPPQPADSWQGVRPATSFGPACPQPSIPETALVFGQERVFSEDCLYLNIWTAGLDAAEKRPVLVWLHHGGFLMGWGGAPFYDGAGMARGGAVHVTINYRLGRFGFLAHPALSRESPTGTSGNYGLMDQVAALEWVRDNIAGFGGDPDCVTVYGVSAGAHSTSVLMTSPLAAGLFHRAIAGSGGAFGPAADSSVGGDFLQEREPAEKLGEDVMTALGATTLDRMRELSADSILTARETKMFGCPPGFLDGTYPILDGHVIRADAQAAYRAGQFHDVPLITGSNAQECAVTPFNPDTDSFVADSRRVFAPFYDRFAGLYPAGENGLTMQSSQNASSDRLFSWQNWAFAREHAARASSPVYYYHFDHAPPVPRGSAFDQQFIADVGAFHSAEIPYALHNLASRDWPWREEDLAMADTLSGYWLDFMRTGDPNGGGRAEWRAFDGVERTRMRFRAGTALSERAPDSARFDFLDDFYAWARAGGTFSPDGATAFAEA